MADPSNEYKPNNIQAKNAQVTVNGRSTDGDLPMKPYNSTYGNVWVIENARLTLHSDFDMANVPVCIDTSVNAYFLLNDTDYANVLASVNKQLCSGDATAPCQASKSSFTNVDNMKVTFNATKPDKTTVSILLGAADFIAADPTGNLQLTGLAPLNQSSACSGATGIQYAVGKLFFSRAELTIQGNVSMCSGWSD